jgi:quercetin dioxygenase-like cupin family protein
MGQSTIENPNRRSFMLSAAVAAAAGFTLADTKMSAEPVKGQGEGTAASANFQLFTAEHIEADMKALQAAPGNKNLVDNKNFTVVLTTETAKSAKEFEWHEGRDHILQILDGSTVYQVGGTPKNGRNTKPGEWLAPESEGATTLTLKKGDMLVIPRNTPHKRSTESSVTLMLISPMGTAASA